MVLFADIRLEGVRREDIERRVEAVFGKGCRPVIEKATTTEMIVERVIELPKTERRFEE